MEKEKSINAFVKDCIAVFGLDNLSIQVKDVSGAVVKQSTGWVEEADFIRAENYSNRQWRNQYQPYGAFYEKKSDANP